MRSGSRFLPGYLLAVATLVTLTGTVYFQTMPWLAAFTLSAALAIVSAGSAYGKK